MALPSSSMFAASLAMLSLLGKYSVLPVDVPARASQVPPASVPDE